MNPGSLKVFLDGRDVTPVPLVSISIFDQNNEEVGCSGDFDYKSSDVSEQFTGNPEQDINSYSSISSDTSSSSEFKKSLTSPRDLGHIELPYDDDVVKNFLLRFRSPSPTEEIIPMKITQERLLELMETKPVQPMKVILSLKETPTFFLLDRPSLTALEGSEEARLIKEDNAHYDFLTIGEGSYRYIKNAETQTKWKVWKSKDIWAPAAETKDNIAEATTYDLYKSFSDIYT